MAALTRAEREIFGRNPRGGTPQRTAAWPHWAEQSFHAAKKEGLDTQSGLSSP
jgi:hypothetical protein